MDKIKINVEILIPDGEDCTYSKNDGSRDSYECLYYKHAFKAIPTCTIFIQNHQYAILEERISGGIMTGYKKCSQCLVRS